MGAGSSKVSVVAQGKSVHPHSPAAGPLAARPLRVLVADDERDTADSLFRLLYHEG